MKQSLKNYENIDLIVFSFCFRKEGKRRMSHFTDLKLIGRQIEQFLQETAKDIGIENLGSAQFMALNYLYQHDGEEIYVKDVEQALNISKSVTSNLIKRMQKNDLIILEASPTDKRFKKVRLTDFGRGQAQRFPEFHRRLETVMFKDVKAEEIEVAIKVINQIQSNISKKEK